jgi:flagellar motility protein MotE (MotC chaperone)
VKFRDKIMRKPSRRYAIPIFVVLLSLVVTIFAFSEEKYPARLTAQDISASAGLKDREDALAAREKALAEKEKELVALNREVDEKFSRLNAQQEEFKGQIGRAAQGRDQEFKKLIKVYSAMSPSKVAPLLGQMEDAEAVEILRAMKVEAVAKIIPKLTPDKAVRVTRLLGLT